MSYIRPLENKACLYIYPESGQIRFMSFPEHNMETISDEMLDVLLAKMSGKEILKRIQHGEILLKALDDEDYDFFKRNKSFYKESGENNENVR